MDVAEEPLKLITPPSSSQRNSIMPPIQVQGPNENGFVKFAVAHPRVITSLNEIAVTYG